MIINPTKKALPIFNKLVKTKDANAAKRFAIANPFFSWHANYYSLNRKKVVILVNDLTYATVILYDINAKNKSKLNQFIEEGIQEAFVMTGISHENIDAYFKIAGSIEVNAGFNRQVTGAMTNLVLMLQHSNTRYLNKLIQTKLMNWLMQVPFRQKNYIFAKKAIKKAFQTNLSIAKSTPELPKDTYEVNKTWTDYHQWDKHENDQTLFTSDGTKYEQVRAEIQENNKLLLAEFQNYLTKVQGLSKKVITKHVNNAEFFIDEFLTYYTILTPLKASNYVMEYLSDWFPRKAAYSVTELKSNATSIKKFFKFMEIAGEISQSNVEIARQGIKEGMELGIEYFQMLDNMEDEW